MRVAITGSEGYVGSALALWLAATGHEVVRIDAGYFADCVFGGNVVPTDLAFLRADVRTLPADLLRGVDGVVHLAGLSNDLLGDVNPTLTHSINVGGAVRVAEAAREAGVSRLIFASSCSVYGDGAGGAVLDESGATHPVTVYAASKLEAESRVSEFARPGFDVTSLRSATVFGPSRRLRLDLVVNEFAAMAHVGEPITLRSTGTAWRPFVHVDDLCRAYAAILECPPGAPGHGVYNVGSELGTFQVIEVAKVVAELAGGDYRVAERAPADTRSYRVDFTRFAEEFPTAAPRVSLRDGVAGLLRALAAADFDRGLLHSAEFRRLARLRELLAAGVLDEGLGVTDGPANQRDELTPVKMAAAEGHDRRKGYHT